MRAVGLLLLALAFVAGCGGGDDEASTTTTTTAASGGCESVEAPAPREPDAEDAPSATLDSSEPYTLTLETNCGSFTITLHPELAPKTTASLVALAEDGYFDDTVFHRVVPGFVIQGGDPTQTGTRGPGYTTVDEPPPSIRYTNGVVAMAKTSLEAPGTAGSQFFVVTAADAGLPAEYAVVGEVTEGMDTVERIDALGVGDGPPSQPVVVSNVKVG